MELGKFMKILKYLGVLVFISVWVYGYFYYPLHTSNTSSNNDLQLIYALHDIKEMQTLDILNIQREEYIGGMRKFQIYAKGDIESVFNKQTMEQGGWHNIETNRNNITAHKKDYCIEVEKNTNKCIITIIIEDDTL